MTVASTEPTTPPREQDIEQQLDELLAQLMEHEPDVVAMPDSIESAQAQTQGYASPAAETDDAAPGGGDGYGQADQAVTMPSSPAEPVAPAMADDADDALASQIQEMLDDARSAEAAVDETPTTVAQPVAAPAASAAAELDAVDVSIQAIDEMLAEAADDAVAGEFETVDEVLSTQAPAAKAAPAAVARSVAAMTQAPPAGDDVAGHDDPDAVPGDFASPEELLRTSTALAADSDADTDAVAGVLTGSAAAVAGELNSGERSEPKGPTPPTASRRRTPAIVTCNRNLRRTLGLINRPLDSVSPSIRNAIGLLGAANIVLGAGMLVYSILHTSP